MSSKLVPDLPKGPLDVYRKQASFDWKQMKIFLETEDVLKHQSEFYEKLHNYPIFFTTNYENDSLDEQRRICALRVLTINSLLVTSPEKNLRRYIADFCIIAQLDFSMTLKAWLRITFASVIQNLGTERHSHYLQETLKENFMPAYCMTEIGHGSNAKHIKTTATYDKKTKEFVLNSPNFEAAKCWAGNLAQTATHAIVFAQLITADGVNHFMHAFIVHIRDPTTLVPYPGITVGDMGHKIGYNGADNGFMMFNQYRIPRENLLNRTGDVLEDGVYVTPYRDSSKRYGASLGALSTGRVVITFGCAINIGQALTIALRYAAVRRQFGPDEDSEEIPILEYQTHQYRLIPYLSVAYVLKMFSTHLMVIHTQFTINLQTEKDEATKDTLADLGLELHAISSASKSVSAWIVRDGIQECREACGGHGYLHASGIGELKNCHDANCTYEGECYVLIQQTSNWLLKLWPLVVRGTKISSPLKSIDFLNNYSQILDGSYNHVRTVEAFASFENISKMYQWLVCYLLKVCHEKYNNLKNSSSTFWAKNESQIFFCQDLAVAYFQHFVVQSTHELMAQAPEEPMRRVLDKLLSLYALFCLHKRHVGTLYEGGYARDPEFVNLLQESILTLCKSLKPDSVALIDAIAPPDFLVRSVLGKSDGEVYKHLEDVLLHCNKLNARPDWWTELRDLREKLNSKL